MILYRLAKWMEERKRLRGLIAEADGNAPLYIRQKAYVEKQMLKEASLYMEPRQADAAKPAFALTTVDSFGFVRPVYGMDTLDAQPAADWRDALAAMRRDAMQPDLGERTADETRMGNKPLRAEELLPEVMLGLPRLAEEAAQPQPQP